MPDRGVQIAMDKQAVAERDRREQVLQAEGTKRSVGMRGNIKERERESKRERESARARARKALTFPLNILDTLKSACA